MTTANRTKNYNLSQFVGTDRPTWLGDYNGDMEKIDTQLKKNADGKVDKTASQPNTLGLTATELDSMYKDADGIVRVGHAAK